MNISSESDSGAHVRDQQALSRFSRRMIQQAHGGLPLYGGAPPRGTAAFAVSSRRAIRLQALLPPHPEDMIRPCQASDFDVILAIINDGAQAYRGVVPGDLLQDPYMSAPDLQHEIARAVVFWGCERDAEVVGVMGIQDVADVTLIRHAYVRTAWRHRGIGTALLKHLRTLTRRPILIGTWAAAHWAIGFYERHGFAVVVGAEKDRLLKKYWAIAQRQIETSVVLREARAPDVGL